MNSKQRVKTALSFEQPDRAPVSACYVPEVAEKLREVVGPDQLDLGAALGNDLVLIPLGFANGYYGSNEPEYVCEWGCTWRWVKNETGAYTEIVKRPLEDDIGALNSYQIPDPYDEARYDDARRLLDQYGRTHWMVGSIPTSIFEAAWGIRGLDTFLMDMIAEKDFANALMDKVMAFPLAAGKKLIEMGVDMLWTGDDVSTQNGMMISMDMWREYLKPRYALLFSEFKKLNPGIKIAYHSCGNCQAIMDEMYEIGLDVINPIQPACMDPAVIKKKFYRKMAMWGGMCVQYILPHGTPNEVKQEVGRLKSICGEGGGYILAPAHNIQSETPLQNILAFYEAALEK